MAAAAVADIVVVVLKDDIFELPKRGETVQQRLARSHGYAARMQFQVSQSDGGKIACFVE